VAGTITSRAGALACGRNLPGLRLILKAVGLVTSVASDDESLDAWNP
jgi:hypothetical protein